MCIPVNYYTLLQYGVLVFRTYQEVSDGITSSEIHFYPMFPADVLAAFTHALYAWDHNVRLFATCVVVLAGPLFVFLLVLFDVDSI